MARYDLPSTTAIREFNFPTNPECILRIRRESTFGDTGAVIRRTFELMPERQDIAEWEDLRMWVALEHFAEGWNLEDAGGQPIAFTRDNFRALDPQDGDAILGLVRQLVHGRPAEAENPFVTASSRSSKAMRSNRRRSS